MRTKLLTPTRLLIAFVLLCALYFTALTLRGPRPALTIMPYGTPAANIVIRDPLSREQWTTDAEGAIYTSSGNGLPALVNIPTGEGSVHLFSLQPGSHTTIDMRGRYTKFTKVKFELGMFKSTSSSTQVSFTDEETAAIERGELSHEEALAKALEEAGVAE